MPFIILFFLLTAPCCLPINGCTGGSGGDAWRYDPGIPVRVTGVVAEAGSNLVTVSWSGNPVAESYRVYVLSELNGSSVTKANGTIYTSDKTSIVIKGLDNNIKYYFMVTALNRDGEGAGSAQVSATPRPISNDDLVGTWYFHTLVTGPEARWERGKVDVNLNNNACDVVISDYEDSAGNTLANPPAGFTTIFTLSVNTEGVLTLAGRDAWSRFHGIMGSRKNMMVATYSTLNSRVITIFQKKRTVDDYWIADIMGTGSNQNPIYPYLQGNGPSRFSYHQLYSGSNTEWEYCNAKIGQHGNVWLDQYKDVIYWDYSTPSFKVVNYDYFYKATSFGIDNTGLVSEYWNYANYPYAVDSNGQIYNFNYLAPKAPHDVVFTGRMTADKTVIVGVGTRTDANGNNPQYFMRIMELCFIPTDQALSKPGLDDLAGQYNFHEIGYSNAGGTASWAYGTMNIDSSGATSLSYDSDSAGSTGLSDAFTLSYYPDPNPDGKSYYRDFANFVTPAQDGTLHYHYYDLSGQLQPYHRYYDFTSYPSNINDPLTWRLEDISPYYFKEHGTMSYNGDMFVMTRTDGYGYSMLIGLN
jgi:hypothetical protein